MPLNATAIKNFKHSGKPTGDKHSDGEGMYLLVKAAGMYWRMDYTLHGKRKTLALGVYPAVSLLDARKGRTAETGAVTASRHICLSRCAEA